MTKSGGLHFDLGSSDLREVRLWSEILSRHTNEMCPEIPAMCSTHMNGEARAACSHPPHSSQGWYEGIACLSSVPGTQHSNFVSKVRST